MGDFCWIGHGSWLQEDQEKENENRGALRQTQRRGTHQSSYCGSHNMEKQEDQRPTYIHSGGGLWACSNRTQERQC